MSEPTTPAVELPLNVIPPDDLLPQGELFDPGQVAREVAFFTGEDGVDARAYARHTGTTTARRTELVDSVLRNHVRGFGVCQLARMHHISTNTVAALLRLARASGKLESAKAAVAHKLDEIIGCQLDTYAQALLDGAIPARDIPIHAGIFIDKRAMIEVSAEVQVAESVPGLSHDAVAALIAGLPAASDSGSDAGPRNTGESA